MRAPKSLNLEVGILGGGQLARMLAESALRMGLKPVVYTEDPHAPALAVAADGVIGKISDSTRLKKFLKRVSLTAFENEFLDCALLKKAASEAKYFPSLKNIELLQDKLSQKRLFQKLKLPSSSFLEISKSSELPWAIQELGGDVVLKWSRQGYDGKGVKVVPKNDPRSGHDFLEAAFSRKIPVYAELRVDFKREVAMIGCRARSGEFAFYPLVISEQESGICKRVTGPACKLGVAKSLENKAIECVSKIGSQTGLVGAFGVEMFETRDGKLLINEVAPRVHNTGHYTQNAFPVSQFENHWRALLGLPLYQPEDSPFFAMLNLLGPAGVALPATEAPLPRPSRHSSLHWYSKGEIRPGRKLGHLNGVAGSKGSLSALLKELKMCEDQWVKELRKK